MNIYHINNEKYNININLKLDSFHIFIESLKESRKYYHDYCNLENININDFDNEYTDNINILKGELLKYYILITNDDDVEKYVTIDDTIEEIYNSTIEIFTNMPTPTITRDVPYKIIIQSFNINYLTKRKLDILIKYYAYFYFESDGHRKLNEDLLKHMNINTDIRQVLYRNHIEVIKYNPDANKNLNNYLDSLIYKTIYERELDKILNNLHDICLSNISSKKLLNCCNDNDINLIDLDNNEEYAEVD